MNPECDDTHRGPDPEAGAEPEDESRSPDDSDRPREIGGPKGPEPTRYGDWERNGRCSDF